MTAEEERVCAVGEDKRQRQNWVVYVGAVILTLFFLLWIVLIAAIVLAKKDDLSHCWGRRGEWKKPIVNISRPVTSNPLIYIHYSVLPFSLIYCRREFYRDCDSSLFFLL